MKVGLTNIEGAVFGLTYGNALGFPLEFMSHEQIRTQRPPYPTTYKISDDAQAAVCVIKAYVDTVLATGERIVNIDKDEQLQNLFARNVAEQLLIWEKDPDNNRAPDNATIRALQRYAASERITGREGAGSNSRSCNPMVRGAWLGLLPYADEDIASMAILQAKVSHQNPDVLLSAALAAVLARHLAKGCMKPSEDGSLIRRAIHLLDNQEFYDGNERLDPSDLRKMFTEALIVFPEYLYSAPNDDICSFFNDGWTAPEALVLAVAATDAQTNSEEATAGIVRLTHSSGDSDSLGALGGAFIGGYRGADDIRLGTGTVRFEDRYVKEFLWVTKKIGGANASYRP